MAFSVSVEVEIVELGHMDTGLACAGTHVGCLVQHKKCSVTVVATFFAIDVSNRFVPCYQCLHT